MAATPAPTDAHELLSIPHAQVFEVQGSHHTDTAEGPLCLVQVQQDEDSDIVMLMCGSFSYPLIGQPVLRIAANSFMLPAEDGSTFGLVCPDEAVAPALDQCLRMYTTMQDKATGEVLQPTDKSITEKLSTGLIAGSEILARGVVAGAKVAGKGVKAVGGFLERKIKKKEKEVTVSDGTKAKLAKAKIASGVAVQVTAGFVASATTMASHLAVAVGDGVASTKAGKALQKRSSGKTGRKLKQVAGAGLTAFGTVWTSLEEATSIVLKEAADASTSVVEHRYGAEAASAAKDGFIVLHGFGKAGLTMKHLGPKALVVKTAKGAAVHVLTTESEEAENPTTPGTPAVAADVPPQSAVP